MRIGSYHLQSNVVWFHFFLRFFVYVCFLTWLLCCLDLLQGAYWPLFDEGQGLLLSINLGKKFFFIVHTRQSGVNFKHLKFYFFRGDESFLLDLSLKFLNRRPSLCHFSPLKDGPMPMRLSSSEILVDPPSLNFFQINKKVWAVMNCCFHHYEASSYGLVMKNYFHFSKKITNWYDYRRRQANLDS